MIINYPRLYSRFYTQPLLLEENQAHAIHVALWPRMTQSASITMTVDEVKAVAPAVNRLGLRQTALWPDKTDGTMYNLAKPGVAVVPVYGVLGKNMDTFDMMCGGCPVDAVGKALDQAAAAKDIKQIVMDFGSPGGEVTGIAEQGNRIASLVAEAKKPVYAFVDSQCCSAAYWLASQCSEIVATPSATLGSIGVYVAWLDPSVAMQLAGYQLQMFAAGDHKGMGMPGRALSAKEREMIQARVDDVYRKFTTAVTSTRVDVTKSVMQGQTFTGEQAIGNGLADVLVNDWEEFVGLL